MSALIRPAYRSGELIGFALIVAGEPVGKVHEQYKQASVLRDELLQEQQQECLEREQDKDDRVSWEDQDADDAGQPRWGEL